MLRCRADAPGIARTWVGELTGPVAKTLVALSTSVDAVTDQIRAVRLRRARSIDDGVRLTARWKAPSLPHMA